MVLCSQNHPSLLRRPLLSCERVSTRSIHSVHLHIFAHFLAQGFRFFVEVLLHIPCIYLYMLSRILDYIIFNSLLPFSFIMMSGSTQCTFAANPKHIERQRRNQLEMRSTVKRRTIERMNGLKEGNHIKVEKTPKKKRRTPFKKDLAGLMCKC